MRAMTNCKNCGAPINRYTCKCEYCGTEYFDGIRDIGKIDEWDEMKPISEACVRATSAGVMTINEARSSLGLDELRELERIMLLSKC